MRRHAAPTVDAVLEEALDDAVETAAIAIARTLAQRTAEQLEIGVRRAVAKVGRGALRPGTRRPRAALRRWAADRRARRVPTFVIELTGLATKKEIVARFGEGVIFEKGKPAPKPAKG